MISKSIEIIEKHLGTNRESATICGVLAIIFAVVGIVLGVLACLVTIWLAVAELFIAVGFVWCIKGLISYNRSNEGILKEIRLTLHDIRGQDDIQRKLR